MIFLMVSTIFELCKFKISISLQGAISVQEIQNIDANKVELVILTTGFLSLSSIPCQKC